MYICRKIHGGVNGQGQESEFWDVNIDGIIITRGQIKGQKDTLKST